MYKKNISVIENALNIAQVEEGAIGDNSVVFTPSSDGNSSYESAKRFSKYLNTIKVCRNKSQAECSEIYYPIKYSKRNDSWNPSHSKIVLSDGSIYLISQYPNCEGDDPTCKKNSDGTCKKDENGNDIPATWHRTACGIICVDVNGTKGPNKFGKDNFLIFVGKNKITIENYAPRGGRTALDIITNKI